MPKFEKRNRVQLKSDANNYRKIRITKKYKAIICLHRQVADSPPPTYTSIVDIW